MGCVRCDSYVLFHDRLLCRVCSSLSPETMAVQESSASRHIFRVLNHTRTMPMPPVIDGGPFE